MKLIFTLITLTFLYTSCSMSGSQEELMKVKMELEIATKFIEEMESKIEPEGDLVHVVFFKLKPDVDPTTVIAEVKKIEAIKEVMDLEIGPFEDLGDARAMSDYSMMLQMSFKDEAAYKVYQNHPIHLKLKENLKPLLGGPPTTYDFMKK